MRIQEFARILAVLLLAVPASAQFKVRSGGSSSSGTVTITSGTTATSGCIAGGVLRSISNKVECGAGLTFDGIDMTIPQGGKLRNAGGSNSYLSLSDAAGTGLYYGVTNSLVIGSNSTTLTGPSGALTINLSSSTLTSGLSITPGGAVVPLTLNNGANAVSPLVVQDNGAAVPTTGATATWNVRDGAIPQVGTGVLTSGTMTAEAQAYARGSMIHSATWTNAQVVALGAATAGDIIAFTLPAKHVVENAYVVITGQGAGTTTLTVSCGRTGAGYIDYIVASDAQAAANTVYGDASGERGTNLTGYDLPSYTGTTAVTCNFVSTGANLDQVTGSTGRVVVITSLIP